AAGGRRAVAADQLRRHFTDHAVGGFRHPDVCPYAPQVDDTRMIDGNWITGRYMTLQISAWLRRHAPAAALALSPMLALAQNYTAASPAVSPFVEEWRADYGFDADLVPQLVAQAERRDSILDAISRPAERVRP